MRNTLFILLMLATPLAQESFAKEKKCEYTYIKDYDEPEIPEEAEKGGKYSDEWKKVLAAGYRLKTVASAVANNPIYIFERCK